MLEMLLVIAGIGMIAGVLLLAAVCACAAKMRNLSPERAECILVLGARVWPDGKLSDTLRYRLERALQAWEQGLAPKLIVSGGCSEDNPESEARAMARWLASRGVPETVIFLEEDSTDTRENLENARKIMDANGLSSAIICTSDYHLTRALWLARSMGIPASGLAAPSPRTLRGFITGRVREAVSWALYFLKMI